MTDRELLELAAKAVGYETKWDQPRGSDRGVLRIKNGDRWEVWNPLNDDGAALRLAVKLKIPLQFPDFKNVARTWGSEESAETFDESALDHDGDLYAATRRAIVRAAAEIGKCGA